MSTNTMLHLLPVISTEKSLRTPPMLDDLVFPSSDLLEITHPELPDIEAYPSARDTTPRLERAEDLHCENFGLILPPGSTFRSASTSGPDDDRNDEAALSDSKVHDPSTVRNFHSWSADIVTNGSHVFATTV